MKLLRLAIEKQDFTLAAHVVVYSAAKLLTEGVTPPKNGKRSSAPGRPQGQPKRT
jgi:hypothetical protein